MFDQFRGLQLTLVNFLSQIHPLRTPRDVDNYLVRLGRVAPVLDEGVDVAGARAAKGTIPPTFILQATIDGIDRFLAAEPADNVLVTSLAARAKLIEGLSQEARAAATGAAERIVCESIRPAFVRVRVLLSEERAIATDDAGLWHLPHGAEAYAAALHVNTTTALTAEEIHALGLPVWIPLPGPDYRILEMRTLTYHEGVPGHHFQIALQQELPEIPVFRRKRVFGGLSAFAEGWGLYAEQLAVEAGWYSGDPKERLGQLSAELFRARRLVVDTGLHAQHWTRQQAVDYGIPAAEVERYVVMPGQACAYKIGELEILAQRAKAQAALGSRFSMKQFHNLLLRTGTVPLAVLRQVVDADIAETLKR